ncbi:hypothetical protein FH972_024296 [Carpinus fangiana]|uniref:Uncharacterized protein n=1 Tax=Carpinus fangiana TaxID=176857 RepID=A0A5N6KY33_9ROSI|nr:hypothetical protein FH972_024296 [Carpinus fangiana]
MPRLPVSGGPTCVAENAKLSAHIPYLIHCPYTALSNLSILPPRFDVRKRRGKPLSSSAFLAWAGCLWLAVFLASVPQLASLLSMSRMAVAQNCPAFNPAPCQPPKGDAFYTIPSAASLTNSAVGSIITYRPQPYIPPAFLPGASGLTAWTVKYVTKNAQGIKTAAITTIVVPSNPSGRILSYQAAYDSADLDCSPSYQLGNHQNNINNFTEPLNFEMGIMALVLDKNWTVIVPDYEGLTASFASGLTSGQAVLDGITAAYNSGSFSRINSSYRVALAGYSGGSLATEWAGELLASYAPSLSASIVGVAAGGIPVNLNNSITLVNGPTSDNSRPVCLIPNALQGLASTYPAFASYLNSNLIPSKIGAFNYSQNSCNDNAYYQGQDIFATYFKPNATLAAFTSGEPYKSVLNTTGIMGKHGRPTRPTYFFQGATDMIAPAFAVTNLYNSYCANPAGLSLEYTLNPNTGHADEAVSGLGGAFQFLQDRFDAKPSVTGCTMRTTEPSSTGFPAPTPYPSNF